MLDEFKMGKLVDAAGALFLLMVGVGVMLIVLSNMMKNSYNFTNHYSYYNGGGSTFNSEFAVNTGFITPLSYTQNAYTFNKNTFTYSMANLFKKEGYNVNAFHMNSGEYYSRSINYKSWGFDHYYSLQDIKDYTDNRRRNSSSCPVKEPLHSDFQHHDLHH